MRPINVQAFFKKKSVFVLLSGFLCTFIMIFVMKLWHADFNFAFVGGSGDCALEMLGIRNLIETGTRNLSDRLSGVGGQQLYDFPVSDALNYGVMYIMSLFTKNTAVILNLFFLLTFPLAAMSAMWALLELKISRPVAMFASLLYSYMSYHFLRGQNHLLLCAYYMVPLEILSVLWLMQGESTIDFSRSKPFRTNLVENRKFLLSVIFCAMISSTGLYYAYFTCFFLCLAIIKKIFAERRWSRTSTTGALLLLTIILGGIANYLPTIIYHLNGGEHASALIRTRESASIYALKLIDLFVPTIGHQIDYIRSLVALFHGAEPLSNENTTVSLGLMGSFGFVMLLIIPLIRFRKNTSRVKLIKNTSFMAYAGFLLATTGGLSSVISWLVFSSIRAYNRICVFFFFFALIAVSVFIDTVIWGKESCADTAEGAMVSVPKHRFLRLRAFFQKHRKKLCLFLIPLLLCALFDQIPNSSVFPYAANKQADQVVEAYFARIETSVPEGTYVYQLPYVEFPEPYQSYGNGPYAQLDGYLNTSTLHWSYGALLGTSSDLWAKAVSQMSAVDMIAALKAAGYGGIYIDLLNYPDDTLATRKDELISLAGSTPIVSEDGQKVFIAIEN